MDAVSTINLSPLRRGLAIDSTVDIFTFYVTHRHVYCEQWIKFMMDGINASSITRHTTFGYNWSADVFFFFSSRRRHTRFDCDWSSDVCSSDLPPAAPRAPGPRAARAAGGTSPRARTACCPATSSGDAR